MESLNERKLSSRLIRPGQPISEDRDWLKFSPAERMDAVWSLTKICLAWKDHSVGPMVKVGAAYKTIIEVAERDQVNLIVMCTNGRSGLSQMFIGPTNTASTILLNRRASEQESGGR